MKINTKSLNYSLLFTVIFLIALAAIFSYGYIGYVANTINNSTLSGQVLKPENILTITGDTGFVLNITLDNLSIVDANDNLSNYIEDNKEVIIKVSLDPDKYQTAVTCNYKIFYEPITPYKASSASQSAQLQELVLVGHASDSLKFEPVPITGLNTKTELYSGSITTDSRTGTAEQAWQLSYRFYNLDVDQTDVVGQSPSGKIIIQGENCYAAKS